MSAPRLMTVRPFERRSKRSSSFENVEDGVVDIVTGSSKQVAKQNMIARRLRDAGRFHSSPQRNSLVKLNADVVG
jgi:hypothetical protein